MAVLPSVTIIIPVRNESAHIERSLRAVFAQDYPSACTEIIVADGMSMDTTREIVGSLQAAHANLRLIDNPGLIVPTGMNAAIQAASGEIIIRVDGHCEIAPDYVRRCVEHLSRDGVDGVGGSVETLGETPAARAIARAMSSPFGVGGSAFRTVTDRTMLADTVPFPAYTRALIERAGPYDEELVRNQDDEFNYRLRKMGAKILLAADVRSRYYSRSSLRSLWRQYFQYGYWKVRVLQKHPRQMSLRQFVPPAFIAALLFTLPLALLTSAAALLVGLIVGLYLISNLTASLLAMRKDDWVTLAYVPMAFATLHAAYGLGFLRGLMSFWRRWGDTEPKTSYSPETGAGC